MPMRLCATFWSVPPTQATKLLRTSTKLRARRVSRRGAQSNARALRSPSRSDRPARRSPPLARDAASFPPSPHRSCSLCPSRHQRRCAICSDQLDGAHIFGAASDFTHPFHATLSTQHLAKVLLLPLLLARGCYVHHALAVRMPPMHSHGSGLDAKDGKMATCGPAAVCCAGLGPNAQAVASPAAHFPPRAFCASLFHLHRARVFRIC